MKNGLPATVLALAVSSAYAQTTGDVTQSSQTSAVSNSGAQSGALAIGGGAGTSSLSATIGGSNVSNQTRNTANGGAGGNGGNAAGGSGTSSVTVNLGSGGNGSGAQPVANAQQTPGGDPVNRSAIQEDIRTVGNPGSMSFATSFSQFNCANIGGVGAGFLGGAFNFGGPLESGPCNARANANALSILSQSVPADNPLRAQLLEAAIRLIANSTSATMDALKAANVAYFVTPDKPPGAPDKSDARTTTPLNQPLVNQPGVYQGNDPLVMSRLGLHQSENDSAQVLPVATQTSIVTPLK